MSNPSDLPYNLRSHIGTDFSEPEEVVLSSTEFRRAQDLYQHAKRHITQAMQPTELAYLKLQPPLGAEIADFLNENGEVERARPRINYNPVTKCLWIRIMPNRVQDCQQCWLKKETFQWTRSGIMSDDEYLNFHPLVGTSKFLITYNYTHFSNKS